MPVFFWTFTPFPDISMLFIILRIFSYSSLYGFGPHHLPLVRILAIYLFLYLCSCDRDKILPLCGSATFENLSRGMECHVPIL